jgi:succinate dehydrogenase/fumarate reductase flavoprotein subunit
MSGTHFDVVVAGSGIAGLTAALTAASHGRSVLVLEKEAVVGGTSCYSEAMVWMPCSRQAEAAGLSDSADDALTYLQSLAEPYFDRPRAQAYVAQAREALAFVEDNSAVRYTLATSSCDYYMDRPGATMGTRALNAGIFDARLLGRDFARVRRPLATTLAFGGMTIAGIEAGHFYQILRSPGSALVAARVIARYCWDRLRGRTRGTRIANGQGVVAALLCRLGELGVEVRTSASLHNLVIEQDRVTGGVVNENGQMRTINADLGVVLATGGFSRSSALTQRFFSHIPEIINHVAFPPEGNTGDGIDQASAIGAKMVETLHAPAAWTPASKVPQPDGTEVLWPHYSDRAKPGVIAIAQNGCRFVNEGIPYVDFVPAMLAACPNGKCEVYLIANRRALRRYGLGAVPPAPLPIERYLRSGYLIEAQSIAALAATLGIGETALAKTFERFNADAERGVDTEFGKGSDFYSRNNGDSAHHPNPCLAPITAPFYAVRLVPGDIATFVGLDTDEHARVRGHDGAIVPGLYAVGNDAATVMGGAYAGAGISVGQGMTFGYLAGRHLGSEELKNGRSLP